MTCTSKFAGTTRILLPPDSKRSGVQLIQATGTQHDFDTQQPYILAADVEHQVFFASVPSSISSDHPWLWIMHYVSSATVMPDDALSDDVEPAEFK